MQQPMKWKIAQEGDWEMESNNFSYANFMYKNNCAETTHNGQ